MVLVVALDNGKLQQHIASFYMDMEFHLKYGLKVI
jgi:hypothetical protein